MHHWGFNVYNGCGGVDFIDVPELMRRTTGRTGIECISEVFERLSAILPGFPKA